MLYVTIRRNGDVTIVDLNGDITLGKNSSLLRETMQNLIARGERKVLLNLSEVGFIDSGGLGELIASHVNITHQGGKLKLVNIQKRVGDLLQITKVHTIFEVYQSEPLAVLSME